MQNFPERESEESFSRDEILGFLEAQGTAGALLPPSALIPSSFPTSFTSSLASPSLLLSAFLSGSIFFTLMIPSYVKFC